MTCESLADIILDMARGAAVPEAARFSVRRHLDRCPSCAAEYARQRELTKGLQALAADAQEWKAPAGMEERLLAAFAAQAGQTAPGDAPATTGRWRYVLATAAMVTLAIWGIREAVERGAPAPISAPRPEIAPPVVSDRNGDASRTTNPPAVINRSGVVRGTTNPPAVSEHRSHASRTTNAPAVSERDVQASRTTNPPAVSERDVQVSRTATTVEFVSIPGAVGLPDLESGTVLRMELPLGVLPEYGLQIAPDAMRTSVEADVLVGQDGQPRAIRLVGVEDVAQDSRSRQ